MSTDEDTTPAPDFEVVQETDAVASRKVTAILITGVVVIIASVAIGGWILDAVRAGLPWHEVASPAVAPRQIAGVHQTPIERDRHGLELRAQQRRSLEGYRWTDREHGIAQIPIERAMQLVVEDPAKTEGGTMNWIRFLLFLPPGGSTFANGVDLLHFVVISITMIAATTIAGLMLYYMIRYRARAVGEVVAPLHGSKRGEIGIITSILSLFIVFWVIGYLQYIRIETPPDDAMIVHVTAKQWMWKFSYPGGRRAINVLTVPVGRPVKLEMTSRDVIHSFYVPAFRIKQDVIPGRYVTAWFQATAPGNYDIYCAEYCGVSHSMMLGTVTVLSQPDYDAWLAHEDGSDELPDEDFAIAGGSGTAATSDMVTLGHAVAARRQCLACHTTSGQRHLGPTWRDLYGATVQLEGGRTVVADEAYLTRSMMDPLADVTAGFRPIMPTYQGVLTAAEAAALVEYIKSLRGGDVPDPGVELPAIDVPDASVTDAGAEAAAHDGGH